MQQFVVILTWKYIIFMEMNPVGHDVRPILGGF